MAQTQHKLITPIGRASFPAVFKARAFEGQEPKYSCTLLLPKGDPTVEEWIKKTKALCAEVAKEKWGSNMPAKLRSPFRDGDEETYDGYAGHWFIRASNDLKHRPAVVRKLRSGAYEPLMEDEFYAGCYCVMSVVPFAYDKSGNRGVSFSLQNILKIRDGEEFGGGASKPDVDFADVGPTEESSEAPEDSMFL